MEAHVTAELLFRILLASIIGGLIGYERHNRSKAAGVRTHCIVAMASAVFTIVSVYGFLGLDADASRIASSVVSGIGFLGAGVIFVRNDSVQGLTTAAGVWATAAVGMSIGTGLYIIGIAAGFAIIAVELLFRHSSYIGDLRVNMGMTLELGADGSVRSVMDTIDSIGCSVLQAKIQPAETENGKCLVLLLSAGRDMEPDHIMQQLSQVKGVRKVKLS